MSSGKVFKTALILSTIAHAFVFVGSFPWMGRATGSGPAPNDYIFIALEPPPAAPRMTPPAPPLRSDTANDRLSTLLNPSPPNPGSNAAKPPTPGKISGLGTVSSQELLSDPQKGQIFSQYFQSIKSRIQTVAARHQTFIVREQGKVAIDFVLGPDGRVLSVNPRSDSPGARDPLLVSRALDIIHESEPFQSFPPEIQAPSISFNITLVFNG